MAQLETRKFIVKTDKGVGGKYHTQKGCTTILGMHTMPATDSLLRYYGITEKCKVCSDIEKKIEQKLREKTTNQQAIIINNACLVIEKQLSRDRLRALSIELGIPFSLRTSKQKLAKNLCRSWLRSGAFKLIQDLAIEAKEHWQERLDKKDKHKPLYYQMMLDYSERVLKDLQKLMT
jgi:hypothetical protein